MTTLREEEHMRLHMLALSKAENAKDIGDCTVVRMGYVVKMLEEELQSQRTADLEAIREGVKAKREDWASNEHERWARWQKHLHSKLYKLVESELSTKNNHLWILPTELYQRWERQIATKYAELSEAEKESDRKEVQPYISDTLSIIEQIMNKKT